MTPDILRSLERYGLHDGMRASCETACRANWPRRHDPLYRGQLRRDLAILKWGRK
jgi:hypothetical protein